MKRIRCAIYTRKSSEEGLEQDFNSLDAQREACAAYISSQKHEGWILLPDHYDDGGVSGGTLQRPSLQRLLKDIGEAQVDQIVVYKIDRLTRSLADFTKLVDHLDAVDASFVSVTQSFNTATSMGRLTLNVLLSFAQFEREVTAERIRDKISASKKRGLWMGGQVPLGYDADGRTLKINEAEAKTIRKLFELYEHYGTVRETKEAVKRLKLKTKKRRASRGEIRGGNFFSRGHVYHILANPVYAGRIRHKSKIYEGQHQAIIDPNRWDAVQAKLEEQSASRRGQRKGLKNSAPLAGKVFDEQGDRLTPSHTNKNGRRYRYYISHRLVKNAGEADITGWRLPAKALENQVNDSIHDHFLNIKPDSLLVKPSAEQIATTQAQLKHLNIDLPYHVQQVLISAGEIRISLEVEAIACLLNVVSRCIRKQALTIVQPFQIRKRGVEAKLVIGNSVNEIDDILLQNIARAHRWYEAIRLGATYTEIASRENTSKRRVQQMVDFAFLAPDIVRSIVEGRQPLGLTSDWLLRHDLPSNWQAQRELFSTLR